MRIYKVSQNFEGYFTGNVPDVGTQYLGTSSVEASQISGMFGKAHEAINLVNKFDSSLLLNISFIFNFGKGGAYGVYLSELDRAIKTKALQKKLEEQGYIVQTDAQGGLTAHSKDGAGKSQEEIQQTIDTLYRDLESKGGSAIGINMSAILSSAKQDASEIGSSDPELWQWIGVLHLGGTIVHEAIHAKGARDEAGPEQGEQMFTQWALPIINEEYKKSLESQGKGETFTPLMISGKQRHAQNKTWYKKAQLSYYQPKKNNSTPVGSDIMGRFPYDLSVNPYGGGMGGWSMLMQQDQKIPIENRLSRQNMTPLPRDIDQAHNSIEEQLRKNTRGFKKYSPHATMEELLSEGYDKDRAYTTLEGLLDEKRPKPLMVPLKKASNSDIIKTAKIKTATLFGWMNNLTISDGSTIPGLGDRVMAWEDRDESFSGEEDEIAAQPRYNPTYDIKGFYYRWIEPMFQPQLWSDFMNNLSNVHPAKRFATKIDPEVTNMLKILSIAKAKIMKKKITSTRFVATSDVMPIIEKLFPNDLIKINVFHYGETDKKEEIYAIWLSHPDANEESIERAEKYLQNKDITPETHKLMDELLGLSKQRDNEINIVINTVNDICKSYSLNQITAKLPNESQSMPKYLIDSLDFVSNNIEELIKVGSLVAEKLGVNKTKIDKNGKSIYFMFNNLRVNFIGE